MIRTVILAALALVCAASNAEAGHRHRSVQPACVETGSVLYPSCMGGDFLAGVRSIRVEMHRERHSRRHHGAAAGLVQRVASVASEIVAHPSGCPSRAFCGCGAAVRVFGRSIRSLWLAANWFRFPRAAPAPGMVAVRRHHVFVLERDLGGNTWLAYDANSGGHATRLHARSIAGYVIVNPGAG